MKNVRDRLSRLEERLKAGTPAAAEGTAPAPSPEHIAQTLRVMESAGIIPSSRATDAAYAEWFSDRRAREESADAPLAKVVSIIRGSR